MYKKRIGIFLGLVIGIVVLFQCKQTSNQASKERLPYLNLHDSVEYVGKDKCIQCHSDVWHDFQHTGMGQSFDEATKSKSKANFHNDASTVFDSILNFYYQAYWKNDSLYFKEYRLNGEDTIHKRIEKIDYIIGSGQHTNSHLVNFKGFIYQAPITFYTQKGVWDMAPGFENGFNTRFTRYIGKECMTCHNGLPEMVEGSINKYDKIKLGIDCERCHGPGEIHIREKTKGNIIDTDKEIDYSIVNPKKLPIEYQNSLCQRCHLQGVSVLKDGKDYDDFKPGMLLSEIMDVYMPEFEGGKDEMIMASHVQRLKQSKCYIAGEMSCITCHNPHKSVKETSKETFSRKCLDCHQEVRQIHLNSNEFKSELELNDNRLSTFDFELMTCSDCHMKKSGSIDIPHVAVTDHYISVNELKVESRKSKVFRDLTCINNSNADELSRIKAYLAYYDKYEQKDYLIDSIEAKIDQNKHIEEYISLLFIKRDYKGIQKYIEASSTREMNAWTNYKVGEAYYQLKKFEKAIQYFKTATQQKNYILDYQLKLGNCYLQLGKLREAERSYRFIISQQDKQPVALSNLAYILVLSKKYDQAELYLKKSIQLDPDYRLSRENLINLYLQKGERSKALEVLTNYLIQHPMDERMLAIKKQLNG